MLTSELLLLHPSNLHSPSQSKQLQGTPRLPSAVCRPLTDTHRPPLFLFLFSITYREQPLQLTRHINTTMAKRLTRSDRELPRSAMSSSVRSSASSRATVRSSLRQPTARHAHSSSVSSRLGAVSPAESVASAGTKRKQRDVDDAASVVTAVSEGEATNINVVVRCRGRSGREVKENSTLVVQTDGVKGKMIELSMGANALSNKSYSFDRVFSQAADQSMIFDDTVKPILDEVSRALPQAQRRC